MNKCKNVFISKANMWYVLLFQTGRRAVYEDSFSCNVSCFTGSARCQRGTRGKGGF